MMAPYAIAHMKIGLKLHETNYKFEQTMRVSVYLTNTLEKAQDFSKKLNFAIPAIADEAKAVNEIKKKRRFTIIIGNPPYQRASANKSAFAEKLVQPYKNLEKSERNIQPLSDDYIKFIAMAQKMIDASGVGVMGMITNNTFLSGRIYRGMRNVLLKSNSGIRLINLHGSGNVKFLDKDIEDKNVFDILQGVSICFLTKGPFTKSVQYDELIGTRSYKYDILFTNKISFNSLVPEPPYFLFVPWSQKDSALYKQYTSLSTIFNFQNVSGKPGDDALLVSWSKEEVIRKLNNFKRMLLNTKNPELSEAGRNIKNACSSDEFTSSKIISYAYRPFDTRYSYYDKNIWTRPVQRLKSCVDGKPILLTTRIVKDSSFSHVFITRLFPDVIFLSNTSSVNCYSFPLSPPKDINSLDFGSETENNLNTDLFEKQINTGVSEEQALNYIYAILHSPEYRVRYYPQLQLDFPRIPLTTSNILFNKLACLGEKIIAAHLLESPSINKPTFIYSGPIYPEVKRVCWLDNTVWINSPATKRGQPAKPGSIGFQGVHEDVWNFYVGGYQVCHKWLKDRKGQTLSKEDIIHYQKIIVAISETIRIMKEIDEVIDEHGGWPGAFIND